MSETTYYVVLEPWTTEIVYKGTSVRSAAEYLTYGLVYGKGSTVNTAVADAKIKAVRVRSLGTKTLKDLVGTLGS